MNFLLIQSLLLAVLSAPTEITMTEKIEARVGSDIITSTDLQIMMERMSQSTEASDKTVRNKALDYLVDQALIRQYLASVDMSVSTREIEQQISNIKASNGIQSTADFRRLLEQQGLSFQAFRQNLRNQLERGKFYQLIKRQTLMTVTETDLKAFFRENAQDYSQNFEVNLRECLIPYGSEQEIKLKLAREYQSSPNKFSECVETHSQSPSAMNDGMIGTFSEDQLREEVANQVFQLREGEVALVKLPQAVQLLLLVDKVDRGPIEFSDVKPELKEAYQKRVMEREFKRLLSELRTRTNIKTASAPTP